MQSILTTSIPHHKVLEGPKIDRVKIECPGVSEGVDITEKD